MRDLDNKASEAKDKKAAIGPDVELDSYSVEPPAHEAIQDLKSLPEADKERMLLAGIDTEESERSGTYIQKDSSSIYAFSHEEGLEVIPIKEALEKLDWVKDYYWKLNAPSVSF